MCPGAVRSSGHAWGAQLSPRREQTGQWGQKQPKPTECWRVYPPFVYPIKTSAVGGEKRQFKPNQQEQSAALGKEDIP